MTSPCLNTLIHEHGVILRVCDVIEGEIAALNGETPFDSDMVRLALLYLRDYPEWFHHPREECLFALGLVRDPQFAEDLAGVMSEHDSQHGATHHLLDLLDQLEAGERQNLPMILGEFLRYLAAQRRHMAFENERVFPWLTAVMEPGDWEDGEGGGEPVAPRLDPLLGDGDPGPFGPLRDRLGRR